MTTEQHIPAFVTFLKPRIITGCHLSHGWIELKNGQSWHPARNQSALLNDLRTKQPSLFTKLIKRWGAK